MATLPEFQVVVKMDDYPCSPIGMVVFSTPPLKHGSKSQGPFSAKSANWEEQPGPPESHITSGAEEGFLGAGFLMQFDRLPLMFSLDNMKKNHPNQPAARGITPWIPETRCSLASNSQKKYFVIGFTEM